MVYSRKTERELIAKGFLITSIPSKKVVISKDFSECIFVSIYSHFVAVAMPSSGKWKCKLTHPSDF